jgi:hypothetical protein
MSLSMDSSRIESLLSFVDRHVRHHGCDHSHRFAQQWARREAVEWDDLLDILEANGAFCDCEVVLNLPEKGDLQTPETATPFDANPWLIPPGFEGDGSALQ